MSQAIVGLSQQEVQERRARFGANTVPEKRPSMIKEFMRRLLHPISLLILLTFGVSVFLGRWADAGIIAALLALNISVDLWQKKRADAALAELKKKTENFVTVLRDGAFYEIPATEVVVDDVVKLAVGDIVPADVVVLKTEHIEVDESATTGESLPQQKKAGETIFAGAVVQSGSALVKVVAVGVATHAGKALFELQEATFQKRSHFEKTIFKMSMYIIAIAVVLASVLFVVLLWRGEPVGEILSFVLVLLIASIPVALPAVLSVLLALGAFALAKKAVVVKNARALEELAGVSVLAIDKTGTITKNELHVGPVRTFNDYTPTDLAVYALLASEPEHKNQIEQAIEQFARERGALAAARSCTLERFVPFSPKSKRTEAYIICNGKKRHILMGAPQVLAEYLSPHEQALVANTVRRFADDGYRSLAVIAAPAGKHTYALVGIFPLFDPPREDSASALAAIRKLGIHIKMLTGDNAAIARFIGALVGLGKQVLTGERLRAVPERQYGELVDRYPIFAEVLPEDKFRFIKHMQRSGRLVAMTGDGVNDAPALAQADVGIAVSGATPAAKGAADVVLLNPGLSVINVAIEQARALFARMQGYALFRISETIRVIFFITFASVAFDAPPVTAAMIVLLALLNDVPVLAIAYDNAPVSTEPIRWRLREILTVATVLGLLGLASSFTLLWFLHSLGLSWALVQTMLFLKLDVAGHSTLYTTRTMDKHFWERPWPSWRFLLPAFSSRVLGTLLALFGVFMVPVSLTMVAFVWVYATVWFVLADMIKVWAFRLLRKRA